MPVVRLRPPVKSLSLLRVVSMNQLTLAQARTRQRVVQNENDENSVAQSTRLTRAKAAGLTNADDNTSLAKKPLQTKKSATGTLNGTTRRRALGDVTNAAKGAEVVQEGKKAAGTKAGLQSKVAQPTAGGVQKLSKSNSSRSALGVKDNNTKSKSSSAEAKKPGSGSGVIGNAKRRTQNSTSTIPSSKDATPDVDEPPRKKSATQEAVLEAHAQSQVEIEVVEEVQDIIADLDAEDLDDPSMCAEYVREIFDYYYALEDATQPNPDYMDHQDDLEWKMRGILVDWLIEVHTRFRLLPETLFLAVNIVDRFLSQKVVPLDKLQLVGITAMFIASKYEEVLSPHVGNFVHVADDGFTIDEVLSAERYTLSTLKYDLSYPNPMNFLRRISKADNYDIQTRTLGKYLMEISLVDHRFLEYKQSHIAAAAMYLARMIYERGGWVGCKVLQSIQSI
jgi:G2/mitotic-specific cyclin 2